MPTNIIDSIQLSGTVYTIQGSGGGNPTVELTQAEYDALVSAGTVSANTYYIITDAQAGDLTQYWTSAQTNSAITEATSGKVDTSTFTAYSAATNTALNNKVNTSAITSSVTSASTDSEIPTAKAVYDAIPQGGSSYTGVSGITINENNEIYYKNFVKTWLTSKHDDRYAVFWFQGSNSKVWIDENSPNGHMSYLRSQFSFGLNSLNMSIGGFALGTNNNINGFNAGGLCNGNTVNGNYSLGVNYQNKTNNSSEFASGQFNKSVSTSTTFGDSGNTLFSVGNGTADNARHNAFEIRQNGDIYLSSGGTDIKLQDHLGGGGSTYTAGRGIDITNDTISVSLPISAGTGTNSVAEGYNTQANGMFSHAEGSGTQANGDSSHAEGRATKASGENSHAEGDSTTASGESSHAEGGGTQASGTSSHAEGSGTKANGDYSHAEGSSTKANGQASHAEGYYTIANNKSEHASGQYNFSSKASDTFGDSGNTLFSVGNGTSSSARHNAFEIRQNGDIYLTSGGTDIKLQDHLGGGGSSINVVQTTGSSTTDVMSQDAVTTQLSGYVTTDTEQHISGRKVFTYSASSGKAIEFKQTSDSAKVGFGIKNSASTNNEVASFEFRPNTFTIDGVQHPLMYFGHYRNNNTANAGVPQTVIGFRQYDQKNAAAYHYLMPLPEKAKTPFSLTTSFKDYYAPMGFKNGSTMITADNTGVADFSSVLGGLKLVKLSQSDYNALTTKDDNTVYFIGDSTNGYTMKIGSANVN